MSWDCAHGIIGDAGGNSDANPSWIGEERIEAPLTAVVQVDIDAAVVRQYEVSYGVSALYRIRIGVEIWEKPGVLFSYEFSR